MKNKLTIDFNLDSPPIIIANIHHEGDLHRAKAIANYAALSGVHGILESSHCPLLSQKDQGALCAHVKLLDLNFLATPNSTPHAKILNDLGVDGFVLDFSSIFAPNAYPLEMLSVIQDFNLPVMINVDLGVELDQIGRANDTLAKRKLNYALLQDNYNASFQTAARLDLLKQLMVLNCPVGLNDKTNNNNAANAAVALGAKIIVKNFTDEHWRNENYANPKQARELVASSHEIARMLAFSCAC